MENLVSDSVKFLSNEVESQEVTAHSLRKALVSVEDVEQFYYDDKKKEGKSLMGNFLLTVAPGFKLCDHSIKLTEEKNFLIKAMGAEIGSYVIEVLASRSKVANTNVVEFLCAQNQLQRAEFSFTGDKYVLTSEAVKSEVKIEVANGFPILSDKVFEEVKRIVNINTHTVNSVLASGVVTAVLASHKIVRKDASLICKPQRPPLGMESVPQLKTVYSNPWINPIVTMLQKSVYNFKDDAEIAKFISTVVTQIPEKSATIKSANMPTQVRTPNIGAIMKMEISSLFDRIETLKPSYKRLYKNYLTGCARVTSVWKILPPLWFLSGSSRPNLEKESALYFGAAGGAHIRAIMSYFHVDGKCYDLSAADFPLDMKNGIYPIKEANFFTFDYANEKILVDDVYNYGMHSKGKPDAGLHFKASCLLKFQIFSIKKHDGTIQGRDTNLEKVMVKARLPTMNTIGLYKDCYPFIACKTSSPGSNEVYIVKFKNADHQVMFLAVMNEIENNIEYSSKNLKHFVGVIATEGDYVKFIKKQLALRINSLFLINQMPIWNPAVNIVGAIERDWGIKPCCMPVTYVPKKQRRWYGSHLSPTSSLVDVQEYGYSLDEALKEHDKGSFGEQYLKFDDSKGVQLDKDDDFLKELEAGVATVKQLNLM